MASSSTEAGRKKRKQTKTKLEGLVAKSSLDCLHVSCAAASKNKCCRGNWYDRTANLFNITEHESLTCQLILQCCSSYCHWRLASQGTEFALSALADSGKNYTFNKLNSQQQCTQHSQQQKLIIFTYPDCYATNCLLRLCS